MNSWAIHSFRDVADADYIAARMACWAQLPVQFLWASQQAFEKYLKFILFLNRLPARDVHHDLRRALELLEKGGIDLALNQYSKKFIEDVDDVGQYRYMEASFTVNWQRIILLDRAVWELRRFCTRDPHQRTMHLVEGKIPPRVQIDNGYLEKVLATKNNPAREALLWQNGYFGRGRRSVSLKGGFIGMNSPLLRTAHLMNEICTLARIPKPVLDSYRNGPWKNP